MINENSQYKDIIEIEKSPPELNIQTQKPVKTEEIEKIKTEIKTQLKQEIPLKPEQNFEQKENSQKIIAGKEDELKITKNTETPQEKNEKDKDPKEMRKEPNFILQMQLLNKEKAKICKE